MLTQEYLKQIIHYDPITGLFTWLPRPVTMFSELRFWKQWCVRYEGKVAGCKSNHDHYILIGIDKILYKAHRLAWLYVTGEFPIDQIDHINHIRDDNRWVNFREATDSVNRKNQSIRKDNTSGHVGVYRDKSRNKWCAEIKSNGIKIYLGRFDDINDAVSSRVDAEIKHGFHKNHGVSHGC